MFSNFAFELIGVGFGGRAFFKVDQAAVPGWDLDTLIAEVGHVFTNTVERVEGGFVSHKLGQENGGAFDVGHVFLLNLFRAKIGILNRSTMSGIMPTVSGSVQQTFLCFEFGRWRMESDVYSTRSPLMRLKADSLTSPKTSEYVKDNGPSPR